MITFYTYIQSFNLETIYFFSDFLLKAISDLLPFKLEPFLLFERLNLVIFLIALSFLLKARSGLSLFAALILGTVSTFSIIYIGASLLPVVIFSPLVCLVLIRHHLIQHRGALPQLAKIILEITTYLASNVLALFYYTISRILYPPKYVNKVEKVIEFTLAFTSFYIFFYFSQFCLVFDYPKEARLFDINSAQQIGEVVFGAERIPFTLIPEIFIAERFSTIIPSLLLFIPLLIAITYNLGRKSLKLESSIKYFICVLFLIIFTSTFFNSKTYLFSPEGILYSIFPGLIWRVYPWFFIVLFFILYLVYSVNKTNFTMKHIVAFSLYLALISFFYERPFQEIYQTTNHVETIDLKNTPSSYLLEQYELTKETLPKKEEHYQEVTNLNEICTVTASRNPAEINNVLDRQIETVWRTQGKQNIGDSITINCSKEINFDRILLSSGPNGADFPRGFQIETGQTPEELKIIKKLPLWMGKVQMTEKNLPYFGPQHEEYVDFNKSHSAKTIKVTLLRGSDVFDWSVSEIRFFNVDRNIRLPEVVK